MATQVDVPFQGWPLSSQDQSKESGNDLVQEMLDHGSISFGRYAIDSLSWEKHSVFSHDTRQEELDKLTCPGLVAKKKAYFEEYYKKIRALKALEEEQPTEIGNANEILVEPIETDPINDRTLECEVDTTKFSVPKAVVQNELHECESTGKVYPSQLVLRNSVNIVEHGMKLTPDSDSLSTSCVTEVAMDKDMHQIDSGTIIVEQGMKSTLDSISLSTSCVTEVATEKDMPQIESAIVNPLQPIRKKTVDKVEHEKKLKQDFDSLSKDWVKLKKGMASIAGMERDELDNKNGKVASAVTKSVGAIKTTNISCGNALRQKVHGPQIKTFKEPKQLTQKVYLRETKNVQLRKLSTGGQVACNTRPNSLSSLNRPLTRAKTSWPNLNKARRDQQKNLDSSASDPSLRKGKSARRSSLDSLMKPTASSNARSIKSEVKRSSVVARKPFPSCVPKVPKRDASHPVLSKRRSSNVLAQNKLQRTRSDMASKIPSHGKKQKQAKAASMSRKRVEPKKLLDLKTRSRKLSEPRKEASPTYKRTKLNEDSPLKKKQRQEKPPWR